MSIENIVQTVMTSKKYSNIIPETINRICNEESIKYKTDKDILRSSKKRLHIISESFLSIANANKIASIKKCIDNDGHISTEMIEQLLLLHISTKEMSSFYKEFYNDIFRVVGNVNSILDIACGRWRNTGSQWVSAFAPTPSHGPPARWDNFPSSYQYPPYLIAGTRLQMLVTISTSPSRKKITRREPRP